MSQQQGNLDSMVRESLRQKIIAGEMEGGYHLSELKISKEYNVSRTPVREALCALCADGLVEMVPHRGAFVAHAAPHSKTDQITAYTLFMGLAAKQAAEKANIEMLMDLETAFAFASDTSKTSTADYISQFETAMDMVEKVANSPTISESISMVKRRTNMVEFFAQASTQRAEVNTQMNLLLAALKRKKADSAEKSMRQVTQQLANAYIASRRSTGSQAESVTEGMNQAFAPKEYKRTHTSRNSAN
ncbi:MAG: GntR family transcriptional regulator [Alphaproteobacteria bacterium]